MTEEQLAAEQPGPVAEADSAAAPTPPPRRTTGAHAVWAKLKSFLAMRQAVVLIGAAAATVVAAALAGLVLGLAYLTPPRSAQKGDLDVSAPVSRAISGWASFRALEAHFPAEHAAIIGSLTADIGTGAAVDAAMFKAFRSMDAVRRREERHFGMARPETLRLTLRAGLALLAHLKAAYGGRACSTMAVDGLTATLQLLGTAADRDMAFWQQADALVAIYLETAAEGMREKRAYPLLTEQQWQAFAVHLLSQGVSEADLAAFANPEKSSQDPATCDVFIKIIDVTSRTGEPATEPIIPFLAQSLVATL